MRRFLSLLILLPLAIVIIALSVANRAPVSLSLDPFDAAAPVISVRAPLFVFLFLALALGVLIGGVATWLRQGKWRRAARHERHTAERQRQELERLRTAGPAVPRPLPTRDAA
jgi:uncharacterized integral membrane protein